MQSDTFARKDQFEVIELGTVRWSVFTPYYCINVPNVEEFRFPYMTYFIDTQERGAELNRISQSWRPGRHHWCNPGGTPGSKKDDPQCRNSSLRGCTVRVLTGTRGGMPGDDTYVYTDPEAWSPILARGAIGGRHARSTPGEENKRFDTGLRYAVRFGLSKWEMQNGAVRDAALVDSPVFDDITITYMRRPQILSWREVTE
jgi:hypothetical protein